MAAKRVHEKSLISGRNTESWFCALQPPPHDNVGLLHPKAFSYSTRHPAPSRWSESASVCSSSGMTRSPVCASYQPTRTSCKLSVVLNLYRVQAAVWVLEPNRHQPPSFSHSHLTLFFKDRALKEIELYACGFLPVYRSGRSRTGSMRRVSSRIFSSHRVINHFSPLGSSTQLSHLKASDQLFNLRSDSIQTPPLWKKPLEYIHLLYIAFIAGSGADLDQSKSGLWKDRVWVKVKGITEVRPKEKGKQKCTAGSTTRSARCRVRTEPVSGSWSEQSRAGEILVPTMHCKKRVTPEDYNGMLWHWYQTELKRDGETAKPSM